MTKSGKSPTLKLAHKENKIVFFIFIKELVEATANLYKIMELLRI